MAVKVLMPKLGLTMKKGKVTGWLKQEGEAVVKGEELVEIMTEKVASKMEAPATGILYRVLAEKGSTVPIIVPIGVIAEAGDDENTLQQAVEEALVEIANNQVEETTKAVVVKKAEVIPIELGGKRKISPRAQRLAQEKGVDLNLMTGSGPEGRIVEQDILDFQEAAAKEQQPQIIPMEGMRGIIAERMSESCRNAARVTIMQEVDVTNLQDLREKINIAFVAQGQDKISYTDLLAAIVARALKENPLLNSRVSAEDIELWGSVNLGIAVALDDGLVVPVLHQAHRLSLAQISARIKALAAKARSGELEPADLQGGTFTISNLGMFGADGFTPIINPPEAGILGVGSIQERPLLKEGVLERRLSMTLSLSFDHRAVDGSPAAQFLGRVKELLENPHPLFRMEETSIRRPLVTGGGKDPKKLLAAFTDGMGKFSQEAPHLAMGFNSLMAPAFAEGELSTKDKELMAVALSVYIKCEYCIAAHVYKALQAGANGEEIFEAAGVAVAFGGGPAMAYTVTLVQDCVQAFSEE